MNKMEKRLLVITMCVAMAFAGAWGVAKAAGNADNSADPVVTTADISDATVSQEPSAQTAVVVDASNNNAEPDSYDARTLEAKEVPAPETEPIPAYTAEPQIEEVVDGVDANATEDDFGVSVNDDYIEALSVDPVELGTGEPAADPSTYAAEYVDISTCTIQIVSQENIVYTGKAIEPEIKVIDSTGAEVDKENYTILSYSNNINAGDGATVKVKGNGTPSSEYTSGCKYYGEKTGVFTIQKASFEPIVKDDLVYSVDKASNYTSENHVFTGKAQQLVELPAEFIDKVQFRLDNTSFSTTIPTATNAGEYKVYFRVTGEVESSNYIVDSSPTAKTFVTAKIKPMPIKISLSGKTRKENYDGETYTVSGLSSDGLTMLPEKNDLDKEDILYKRGTAIPKVTSSEAGKHLMHLDADDFSVDNTNYDPTFIIETDGYLEIAHRVAELAWTPSGDSIEKNVTPTAKVTNLLPGDTCTVTVGTSISSNTLVATAEVLSNDNYALPSNVKKTYTITGSDNPPAGYVSLNDCDVTFTTAGPYKYTGQGIEPAVTVTYGSGTNKVTLVKDTDYTVTYSNNVNPGTDTASVVVTGKGNSSVAYTEGACKYVGSQEKKFSIEKAAFAPTANDLTYSVESGTTTGKTQTLVTVPTGYQGKVEFSLDGINFSTTVPTASAAGEYKVYYRQVGSTGTSDYITAVVNKLAATVSISGKAQTVSYDGKEHTVEGYSKITINVTGSGYTNTNDIVYIPTGGKPKVTATAVGKHTMNLKASDFKNVNPNYDITFKIVTDGYLEITEAGKTMNVTITSAEGIYGDGKEHQIKVTVSGPTNYTVYYKIDNGSFTTTNPSFKGVDAGYCKVYVKVEADGYETYGANGDKYGYVDIEPKPLTITWGKTTLTYTGSYQAPTVSLSGKVSGDSLSYSIDGKEKDVGGPYTAYLELTGSDADNYEIPDGKDEIDFYIQKSTTSTTSSTTSSSTTKSSTTGSNSSTTSKTTTTTGTTTTKSGTTTTGTTTSKSGTTTTGSTTSKSGTTSSSSGSTTSSSGSSSTDYGATSSYNDSTSGTTGDDPLGMSSVDSSSSYDDSSDTDSFDNTAEYESEEEEEEDKDKDGDDDSDDDWDEDSYEVDYDEYDTEGMMTYGRAVHLADPDNHAVIIWILIVAVGLSIIAGIVFLVISNLKEKSKL